MERRHRRGLLFGFLLGTMGCAGASARSPEATVGAFASALRAGSHADAYEMMSASYRRRVPFEEFRRHLAEHPEEARDLAAAIADRERRAEVDAVVALHDGEVLRLVREKGTWRLSGNVVAFYDQSTPRAALRSFVRALERKRYDVVMRFVPSADLEGMSIERMKDAWEGEGREEIERLLANLRTSLDKPIEVVGDRATMPYGERFAVKFLREEGVWKIEDPD